MEGSLYLKDERNHSDYSLSIILLPRHTAGQLLTKMALAKFFKPIVANKFLVFLFKGFLLMMRYLIVYVSSQGV